MRSLLRVGAAALWLSLCARVGAIALNVDDEASIRAAAKTLAFDTMSWYHGNESGQTPGLLPAPYYWWEGGGLMGSMLDYWYYTGDGTYNDVITQGLLWQVGDNQDYMPRNATKSLGNDDQGFWGMAAMRAAEINFQNPPPTQPQWLALAQAVFNSFVYYWYMNNESCGGGLKWQKFTFNTGWDYKNAISNGCFFNLAARLAVYTGNTTYVEWAEKVWDWEVGIGLIDGDYNVYDGTNDLQNCSTIDHTEWTYNGGIHLNGAAALYNYTNGSALWGARTQGLLNACINNYFSGTGVMYEVCEPSKLCNNDQFSFKAYLSRWMAATTKLAPFTRDQIIPYLKASAYAAAAQCNGGSTGTICGTTWTNALGANDGLTGVGQEMSALETVQSLLIKQAVNTVTNTTGGTSPGTNHYGTPGITDDYVVTTGDKAGAGILTSIVLFSLTAGSWWMIV